MQSNNTIEKSDQLDLARPARYDRSIPGHDSSICVIKDGKVIYANAEERFTLKKHEGESTKNIIIDIRSNLDKDTIKELETWQRTIRIGTTDHHISHIYEVFYNSGFDEAAVFVNDGCGTANDCITLAYMKRGEAPRILKKFKDEYSLGKLYSLLSVNTFVATGSMNHCEGKLMGLASYGTPIEDLTLVDIVGDELLWNVEALNEMGINFTSSGEADGLNIGGFCKYPILIQANYAATLQRDFENCSIKAVKLLYSLLKENNIKTDNLCLSGGCILNCPANSKIVDLKLFKNYYASPNPTDGGVCFGLLYNQLIQENKENAFQYTRLSTPYLGYNYSYDRIIRDLQYSPHYGDFRKAIVNLEEESLHTLYNLLLEQKILCWYQGGAEFGPRALGHRSLLADPRTFAMNQRLNTIKGRELWRPLAPIVPEELFKDVFEVENTDLCEFMLRTLKIKKKWVPLLRGVCHTDGTARPQLLKKSLNPELYNLLMLWYRKTGCPALINTSLNLAGLPIVERSSQVLDLMYESKAPELVGVFVGSSTEMTVVSNRIF